jgi:hypothetical protein
VNHEEGDGFMIVDTATPEMEIRPKSRVSMTAESKRRSGMAV